MKHPVRLERQSGVAVIAIDNPPVNALSTAVRRGILGALEACLSDERITAIVLAANGRTFPAGADISEFGQPLQQPGLPDLCDLIEASDKPVIAALHGTTLGGGLELAMAAHYRVAHEDTQLGLPEINLGILPGAGGTQRTPRLVGVDAALDLMLSGKPISAQKALEIRLIDGVVGDDLRETVKALAADTDETKPTRDRRDCLADGAHYMSRVSERRRQNDHRFAAKKIIDCVESALLLPFDVGIEVERDAFSECLASRASAGLRHAFFAERRAPKFPELKQASARQVDRVGVIGGGLMGSGIVIACLSAGLPVTLVEEGETGVNAALDRIGEHYKRAVSTGRMTQGQGTSALNYLNLTTEIDALRDADVIIEALPEDMVLKEAVFAKLGRLAKSGAVLASNTSYQNVKDLADAAGRKTDVVAMHFFAPAHRMKLVEIGVTEDTDATAVVTAHSLAKALGKIPVRATAQPALLGNRILQGYRKVADRLLLSGATPAQIDTAMRDFGMPLGPYEAQDLSGLDVSWALRRRNTDWPAPLDLELADRMCEAGWTGQKAGQGYYVYPDGRRTGEPNPDMLKMLADERADKERSVFAFTGQDIRDRLLCSMINTGAQLLEEGVASCASDIDVVMLHGFGFPREKGGPMHQADALTPHHVARLIEGLAEVDPDLWSLSPLLSKLATERQKFEQL